MSPASYQTAPPRVGVLARAGNGTRTRDPNLGKVVLYQLSYSRVAENLTVPGLIYYPPPRSGGEGDRTPDLVNAIHALSQLSYAPINIGSPHARATAARQASPRPGGCQAEPCRPQGASGRASEEPW